jgi:hypothetical protein
MFFGQGEMFFGQGEMFFGQGEFVNKDSISAVTAEETCGKGLIMPELGLVRWDRLVSKSYRGR